MVGLMVFMKIFEVWNFWAMKGFKRLRFLVGYVGEHGVFGGLCG